MHSTAKNARVDARVLHAHVILVLLICKKQFITQLICLKYLKHFYYRPVLATLIINTQHRCVSVVGSVDLKQRLRSSVNRSSTIRTLYCYFVRLQYTENV